ncbi:hypothetical protein N0V90_011440 [Kalmusia sp. IMI 367209]|nr:hypothetical protein N0V90_011440 [Kalmusia sp. IMI 367209]
MRATKTSVALGLLAAVANAAPFKTSAVKRQDGGKIVAAHFMIGIMQNRESAADYDDDMKRAKAAGIDAFALNIAKDDYTDAQLGYAYESAANNDMKVFISFDYNYFETGENELVGAKLKDYCGKPGQLQVDGKCFASSFNGDTDPAKLFNAQTIRTAAGLDLYLVPNLSPTGIRDATSVDDIDGSFNWIGWDSNGANRAPTAEANVSTSEFDSKYTEWLGGKAYMAPVSPWFFTNFASKAWNFPGDLLWFRRWNEILALAPQMIEIITWNDYGESHYVGSDAETSKHTDDGSSAWANGMPHGGWLEMAEPFIAAYKAGAKEVTVSEEKLVYWYRPSPKAACGAFDGIDTLQDAVFVVALLKSAGKVTVTSGANTQTFDAPAGASAYQVDMGTGKQTFSLARDGADVLSGTGSLEISENCSPVNLNAFVGVAKGDSASVPATPSSPAPVSNTTDAAQVPEVTQTAAPIASVVSEIGSIVASLPAVSSPAVTPGAKPPVTSAEAAAGTYTATPSAVQPPSGGKCTATITASEQIRPTNCLGAGQAWAGDGDIPSRCQKTSGTVQVKFHQDTLLNVRYRTVEHLNFNPKIRDWNPPDSVREEFTPPKDRAHFADPDKKNLFSVATATDLTEGIGTLLTGVQLSQLTPEQLDDLALLVAERGVVFFRDQDLTTTTQVKLFEHYGILDKHPAQKDVRHVTIKGSSSDYRQDSVYTPWPQAGWHADTSFEINPPSYSMLRMEEHPEVGGDTAWVSQYGLFDALSPTYQTLFENLHAVHTSRLQYDTILDLWGVGPNRPPIDTHHPAVRTHPVTGLKAWNVNEGFVTGFAELKKAESDKLLDFANYHIHSADDHLVRWKWAVGSVAMWDNRAVIHRVIPGKYKPGARRGVRTTVFGEKPYLDPKSESREEKERRIEREQEKAVNGEPSNGQAVNGAKVNGN